MAEARVVELEIPHRMTTQQWHSELESALDSASDNKINAARRMELLAARCRGHAKSTIGDWHFEQSLGLAATLLADAGRHKDAARLYRRLARHHARSLAYQGRALASAQTALALTLFAARDPVAGPRSHGFQMSSSPDRSQPSPESSPIRRLARTSVLIAALCASLSPAAVGCAGQT